ncbi:MAG: right-handed parallel beta-helix repeat-containing protein [Candidatus Amulumruptor caecigallinarius]|nr:right-handed parallel beta-helix repeat-containing protein [Candidatus Amulumruptor caecigallinarius]
MKLKQLTLPAAAGLLMVGMISCASDNPSMPDNDGNVKFTAKLANVPQTRAFGQGDQAVDLTVLVYSYDTRLQKYNYLISRTATFHNLQATVDVPLVDGMKYDIVFFASRGNSVYSLDAEKGTMQIDYSKMNLYNEAGEKYYDDDCFYKVLKDYTVSGDENVTLTRPVAQINIGANDQEKAIAAADGKFKNGIVSRVTLPVYSKMDLLSGKAMGTCEQVGFTKKEYNDALANEGFVVDGYKYLDYCYALVESEGQMENLRYEAFNSIDATQPVVAIDVPNVPVKRNYRTNIYGTLLTGSTNWTIDIDNNWDGNFGIGGEEFDADKIADGGNYNVTSPVDEITIPDNIASALTFNINEKVGKITMGNIQNPVTINVAKGVEYPEIAFEKGAVVKGLTINGDKNSDKVLKGFDFYENSSLVRPNTLENLTINGVVFEGSGFESQYSINTKNIVIKNCKFLNMKKTAVRTQQTGSSTNFYNENFTMENCVIEYAPDASNNSNGLYLNEITGEVVVNNTVIKNCKYQGIQVTGRKAAGVTNVTLTNNTITGSADDGIKVQTLNGNIVIESNTLSNNKGNGIRIKNAIDGNNISIFSNKIDMAGANPFNNGEPCAILLINDNENAAAATVRIGYNTLTNSNGHDFSKVKVKLTDDSNVNNPFN